MAKHLKNYRSIYEGIVIQNDDPAGMGRVKVFIPAIHLDLVLQGEDYNKNVNVSNFGENVQADNSLDITKYLDSLRQKITQWSRVIQPIAGETGDLKYNSADKLSTPSDSQDYDAMFDLDGGDGSTPPSPDGAGGIYEDFQDVWGSQSNSGGINVNSTTGAYPFNKRNHQSKGSFGTIGVNTHVWVQFVNGNPLEPLVIGAAPSAGSMQEWMTPDIQPGAFENYSNGPGQTST
jgi:hypothetical protein